MRMFRLLRADEIETRVAEVAKDGSWLTLLLYKTARTDASLLDEVVGPLNWANDYKVIDDKMYCSIGIRSGETGEWVWKWNVGTESNTEAEKGEASDAMKRAGFVWGIGAELYSAPRIYIRQGDAEIKEKRNGSGYTCYDRFDVSRIEYDENERIKTLEIVNAKTGKVVYTMGKKAPSTASRSTSPVTSDRGGQDEGRGAKVRRDESSRPTETGDAGRGALMGAATGTKDGTSRTPSTTDAGAAPGTQMSMPEAETRKCRLCGKNVPIAEINESIRLTKKAICGECRESYIKWKNEQNDNGRI